MPELYIGLMSGTSLDGIDASLVDFGNDKVQQLAFFYQAFPQELRDKIQAISQAEQPVLLEDYGKLDCELGTLFARAALALLEQAQIPAGEIQAIGSHGQTVYHYPAATSGFSLQIGDPNRIAQLTGITTIADFRRRDMAADGQGAPLVPAFHQAVFAEKHQPRTIVNIGGIANITLLNDRPVIGFDTGPGNTLLDLWCLKHLNKPYDHDGVWAASGECIAELLAELKADRYFELPAPKSTGKEYFSLAWLEQKLSRLPEFQPNDVQATLLQLSAETIADSINQYAPGTAITLVCGGGIHNRHLLKALAENLHCPVISTKEMGIEPDHVEACAFAWLARQTLNQLPGNLCSVTGASTPVVLGAIYPGLNFKNPSNPA